MPDLLLKREMPAPRQGRKRGASGATRKVAAKAPRRKLDLSFNWLNRLFILVGVGVVLAAGLQAYMTLESIPVEQISVTGKLEHTQKETVQVAMVIRKQMM